MTIYPIILEAWHIICGNKWRSLLSAFGVFWGIYIMVILSATGTYISGMITQILDSTPSTVVCFSTLPTTIPYRGHDTGRESPISIASIEKTAEALGPKLSAIGLSSTFTVQNRTFDIKYKERTNTVPIQGLNDVYLNNSPLQILHGRGISRKDSEELRSVCVLGDALAEQLFAEEDPIGKCVELEGHMYTVIGTCNSLVPISSQPDASYVVLLPIRLLQHIFLEGDKSVTNVALIFSDDADLDICIQEAKHHLAVENDISPEDKEAILAVRMDEYAKAFEYMDSGIILLVLLGGIGILMAGLVGVSSIIFATIEERTRDIAMRQVIGASRGDIVLQIMSESVILSLSSGISGLVAAFWTIQIGRHILQNLGYNHNMLFVPGIAVCSALLVTILGGMAAAWAPVHKTLKIQLVEALDND